MRKKILTGLSIIIVGLVVTMLFSSGDHDHADDKKDLSGKKRGDANKDDHKNEKKIVKLSKSEMAEFKIGTATAGAGWLQFKITLTGEIVINKDRKARILSTVSGVVSQIKKNLGDDVYKGEVLAIVRSRGLANLVAAYLSDKALLVLAKSKFKREQRLWKKRISAEKDFLEAKQSLAKIKIRLLAKEQNLRAIGFSGTQIGRLSFKNKNDFTYFRVLAPLSGKIIKKQLTLGENVGTDSLLFEIADNRSVWVDMNVYPQDLSYVRKGRYVKIISGLNDVTDSGRVIYVSSIADEKTRTIKARVLLNNRSGRWRPGLFVTGKIVSRKIHVSISVPKSALQTIDGHTSVFVKTKAGFSPREVVLGRQTDFQVEIKSGLKRGETYVSSGGLVLKAELEKSSFGDGHAH